MLVIRVRVNKSRNLSCYFGGHFYHGSTSTTGI